jgi:sterol desaturase/sphingolipid hydroxylase (fatty acid hydroxylase superfamily)
MTDQLAKAMFGAWGYWFATIFISSAVLALLEIAARAAGRAERQSFGSYLRGAANLSLYIVLGVTLGTAISVAMSIASIKPLLQLNLAQVARDAGGVFGAALNWAIFPFAIYLIYDAFYYFFHRAQHAVPFLWRFHAVHHSIREMNAFNSSHHISEEIFRLFLITVPMTALIGVSTETTFVVLLLRGWGQFVHSNLNLNLGPIEYVVATPRFHRIHHSIEPHHVNRNFATFFPIFDLIFGTAHMPRKGEFPRTGIAGTPEPSTPLQQVMMPFAKARDE